MGELPKRLAVYPTIVGYYSDLFLDFKTGHLGGYIEHAVTRLITFPTRFSGLAADLSDLIW
jgi:hypothetical protein